MATVNQLLARSPNGQGSKRSTSITFHEATLRSLEEIAAEFGVSLSFWINNQALKDPEARRRALQYYEDGQEQK